MNLESLEARRLFDVNVIEGYPGFYEIHGSEDTDVIVAEINMAEESMTVDGTVYEGVVYIVAYGYAGDDYICITTIDGAGLIGASVASGDGNDQVTLAVDGGLWAGDGDDELYLYDSFRGEVYGEAGDDYMNISGGCADAEIRGGEGNDYIDCSSNYYGVVVFGGNGNDTITGSALGDQLHGDNGNDVIDGGGGDDMFYAVGGGVDQISGGEGNDVAYIDHNHDQTYDAEQVFA